MKGSRYLIDTPISTGRSVRSMIDRPQKTNLQYSSSIIDLQ